MFNSHNDIAAFHDDRVRLSPAERDTMRARRNTNRKRLKDGLAADKQPKPVGCHTQGSYAMRTMIQHSANDYDIDDGVYFKKDDLVGTGGGDKTALAARQMVCEAVQDDRFTVPPEVRKNCVRVVYNEGYHVDIPVYRTYEQDGKAIYELASSDWKASDPLAVTQWFNDANRTKSPNTDNYGQLNRIVKLLKAFARSRESWRSRIASGFMISKLVVDHYSAQKDRDDLALRNSMQNIYHALSWSLVITHPVLIGETLTKGEDDSRASFMRDKLKWALEELAVLDQYDCTEDMARKAWDSVFNTDFFRERGTPKRAEEVTSATILGSKELSPKSDAYDKRGGNRYG